MYVYIHILLFSCSEGHENGPDEILHFNRQVELAIEGNQPTESGLYL